MKLAAPQFDADRWSKPMFAQNRSAAMIRALSRLRDERGSATAEYAVATMAAVGFAGLLVVLLRGDEVRDILADLVKRALSAAG